MKHWESKGGRVSCIVDKDLWRVLFMMLLLAPAAVILAIFNKPLSKGDHYAKVVKERFGDPETLERERPGHVDTPADHQARQATLNEAMGK